jgi:DNA-directed RNA polymerase subunit RPC12/RpoP
MLIRCPYCRGETVEYFGHNMTPIYECFNCGIRLQDDPWLESINIVEEKGGETSE